MLQSPPRILVTAPRLSGKAEARLRAAGLDPVFLGPANDPAEVAPLMASGGFDAVISRTHAITAADIEAAGPRLRLIVKHGAGVDNIDRDAASSAGVGVTSTPGQNARSVAELALGLMLAAARQIAAYSAEVASGRWDRTRWAGREITGRRLGLIGFGAIGGHLADMASSIGMEVVVFDPYTDPARIAAAGATAVTLPELLRDADVVSLHCPLNAATRHLLDAAAIAAMRPGAIVINTARGGLIDEAALHAALERGHLAGAGLDTLEDEDLRPDSPLRRCPLAVITPHIGGSTREATIRVAEQAAEIVIRALSCGLEASDTLNSVTVAPIEARVYDAPQPQSQDEIPTQ